MGYFVSVEANVNIFVEDVNPGGEQTILFIHGWPANHKLFEYQLNVLPALGYRCVAVDLRGFGSSDKPWGNYSYNRMADDIRCVVDALGLRQFVLAGHSVGGAIAIRYMARHHGHGVTRLVLMAAAAPSFTQRPDFPYGLPKQDVDRLIRLTYSDRPQMLREFGTMFFYQKVTEPFSDWFFQLGLQAGGHTTAALAVSLRNESLFSELGLIQVPTLIVHGVHDKVCPPELGAALNKGIRNSRLVWFENSGHGLFWEQRDQLNAELKRFTG